MKRYELEISFPHQVNNNEEVQTETLAAEGVLNKFKAMNWYQLLILQLQLQTGATTFTVTCTDTSQSIQISLNEYSTAQHLEFKLESDIVLEDIQKNLFGLFSFKSKDYVTFRGLSLQQAQAMLTHFVQAEIDELKQQYRQSLHVADPASPSI